MKTRTRITDDIGLTLWSMFLLVCLAFSLKAGYGGGVKDVPVEWAQIAAWVFTVLGFATLMHVMTRSNPDLHKTISVMLAVLAVLAVLILADSWYAERLPHPLSVLQFASGALLVFLVPMLIIWFRRT